MKTFGYIRVSRDDQNLDLQKDAMQKYGCDRIFEEKMSGAKDDRPQFRLMLEMAREGDIIVVWKLDRLGRSLKTLIETVNSLQHQNIQFVSLKEKIDTTSATGKLMFHVMAALAEFERDILRERTNAGLEAARARGRKGGRPAMKLDQKKLARAKELYSQKQMSVEEIMKLTGFKNRSTFYKYVVNA